MGKNRSKSKTSHKLNQTSKSSNQTRKSKMSFRRVSDIGKPYPRQSTNKDDNPRISNIDFRRYSEEYTSKREDLREKAHHLSESIYSKARKITKDGSHQFHNMAKEMDWTVGIMALSCESIRDLSVMEAEGQILKTTDNIMDILINYDDKDVRSVVELPMKIVNAFKKISKFSFFKKFTGNRDLITYISKIHACANQENIKSILLSRSKNQQESGKTATEKEFGSIYNHGITRPIKKAATVIMALNQIAEHMGWESITGDDVMPGSIQASDSILYRYYRDMDVRFQHYDVLTILRMRGEDDLTRATSEIVDLVETHRNREDRLKFKTTIKSLQNLRNQLNATVSPLFEFIIEKSASSVRNRMMSPTPSQLQSRMKITVDNRPAFGKTEVIRLNDEEMKDRVK